MSMTTSPTADNGVNVEALLGAREHMTQAPELAKFKWTASCEWMAGTHSRTTVGTFFGAGADQSRKQPHIVETDHPEIFASKDIAMTPPEMVLAGLAGCLTAGVASVATHRGIQLRSVIATVEAGMDLQGILGIDGDVRNGFDGIAVHYRIEADATRAELEAVVAQSQKRSAVFDIVANPTNITVDVV
jgi:uncharacterized OsmC-like protein